MDKPEDADFMKNKVLEINGHVEKYNGDHAGRYRIDTQVIEYSPAALLPKDCQTYSRQLENKTTDEGVKKGDGKIIKPADRFRCAKNPPRGEHLPDSHEQKYTKEGGKPDDELVVKDQHIQANLRSLCRGMNKPVSF
jgi:hypothetical protein